MFLFKRLPPLTATKSRSKLYSYPTNFVLETDLNKNCNINVSKLCKSLSSLHNLTKKTKHQKLKSIDSEYKAAIKLLRRSNFPQIPVWFNNGVQVRRIHTSSIRCNQPNWGRNYDDDSLLSKVIACLIVGGLVLFVYLSGPGEDPPEGHDRYVTYSFFVQHMLAKGEVEQIIMRPDVDVVSIVLYEGAIIKGRRAPYRMYHMNIGNIETFEEKLRETEKKLGVQGEGVPITYYMYDTLVSNILATILFTILFLCVFNATKGFGMNISFEGLKHLTRAKFTLVDGTILRSKGVKMADVAGLKEAKIEVMEFVDYLKRPDHYKILGAKVPKGALLLGPPGCGKTLLAKAVANEADVPFLSMNGSEFIEIIGGLGAARVRDLFKEASSRAPCIIYIDEMDAIGRMRSMTSWGVGGGEAEQTLNQLLVEMDGMQSKDGVIVLASTNRADVLDKALLRPGRFDRHILIDLPTLQEREELFEQYCKKIVLEKLPPYYIKRLAYLTPGFSGADIANVCNEAAIHAATNMQNIVKAADLQHAIEKVVGGTEKRNHAMSPTEKKIVAYHESGHALVGWLLEHTDALLKVTIVPRTNLALGFAQYTGSDQKLYSKEELFDRMCMALGGRAAEAITFNSITSGAQNDLDKVTKIAYAQVKIYGMSPRVGLVSYPDETTGKNPYSNQLKNLIDLEARKIIADAYYRTEDILKTNVQKLENLAEELLKKETLNFEEVKAILGPPPYPRKKFIDPIEFENNLKEMERAAASPESSDIGGSSQKPSLTKELIN